MWLALVPFGVAVLFGAAAPCRAEASPDDVPVPIPDRPRARTRRGRRSRPRRAGAARTAARAGARARLGDPRLPLARGGRGDAGISAGRASAVDAALVEARAGGRRVRCFACGPCSSRASSRSFGASSRRASSPTSSPRSAGAFVRSMKIAGLVRRAHARSRDEPALRAMFKEMWNAFLGLEGTAGVRRRRSTSSARSTLSTSRAPHPSPAMRDGDRGGAPRGARDASACAGASRRPSATRPRSGALERIRRLAAIDPTYPAAYARGVASFRRADYRGASEAFQTWLAAHPEGPLSLRAQLVPARRRRGPRGRSDPMRALLVDDDHELARLLRDYLGPHGVSRRSRRGGRWRPRAPRRDGAIPTTSSCST